MVCAITLLDTRYQILGIIYISFYKQFNAMSLIKSKIKYLLPSIRHPAFRKGFTLVELLVAITIFGVITTIVVVNFRTGQKQDFLDLSADKLVNNIKRAQTAAITGELVGGEVPAGGFGLHFASGENFYIYFADEDMSHNYNGDLILAEYNLEQNVLLDSDLDIVFDPPLPTVYFDGLTTKNEEEIVLKSTDESITLKKIIINSVSGRIDIE